MGIGASPYSIQRRNVKEGISGIVGVNRRIANRKCDRIFDL
jgi:hypothetical protein